VEGRSTVKDRLIRGSLRPHESTPQRAFRSVHPFLSGSQVYLPMCLTHGLTNHGKCGLCSSRPHLCGVCDAAAGACSLVHAVGECVNVVIVFIPGIFLE